MLKSVPILCRFKNLSVVLCVTLWYSNFSICLTLTHIVTYGNILEYLKPFLAGHKRDFRSFRNGAAIFFCPFASWRGLLRSALRAEKRSKIRAESPAKEIREENKPISRAELLHNTIRAENNHKSRAKTVKSTIRAGNPP